MFSDYCPIISAEVSKGDAIEFFSDRNEEEVLVFPSAVDFYTNIFCGRTAHTICRKPLILQGARQVGKPYPIGRWAFRSGCIILL